MLRGLNWELTVMPKAGGNSSSSNTQAAKSRTPIRAGQTSSLIRTCTRRGGK